MQDVVVGLEAGHILLNLVLFLLMLLNVVADRLVELEIDFANFLDVEGAGGNGEKPDAHGKEQKQWFNCDVADYRPNPGLEAFPGTVTRSRATHAGLKDLFCCTDLLNSTPHWYVSESKIFSNQTLCLRIFVENLLFKGLRLSKPHKRLNCHCSKTESQQTRLAFCYYLELAHGALVCP